MGRHGPETAPEVLLLCQIHQFLSFAKELPATCYATQSTLAEACRCSERNLRRTLNKLNAAGWIEYWTVRKGYRITKSFVRMKIPPHLEGQINELEQNHFDAMQDGIEKHNEGR